MKISVCITVLNEEDTISDLLNSLFFQSLKPDEIVIVDGGSKDRTVQIIRHFQKKYGFIKLLQEKCSRARGRNLSIEIARNSIIAMTDAGCIVDKDWLKNITLPFANTREVQVVAGFYKMTGNTKFQRAESVFLGVTPRKFNSNFLPSTRSIAFLKNVWEKVGGFPENISGAGEDTIFNKKLIENGVKISHMKNATVEWGMPETIYNFQLSIFNYAKGDARSKNWIFPGKGIMSHNIKALSIFARYLIFVVISVYCLLHATYYLPVICLFAYFFWSFRKVFLEFGDWQAALWGPVLQMVSDFAVMRGFTKGLIEKS